MLTSKVILMGGALLAGAAAFVFGSTRALSRTETDATRAASVEEARAIGTEAYLYGYPLVTSEMTRRVMTNAASPGGMHAPAGQFVHLRSYPTADMKDVTTPNADTLYSSAWLDVSAEPWVLSIPDMQSRYYLLPMLDAWSEVFEVPGTRTTGTGPQTYVITGPGWKGKLPPGMREYKSATNLVWLIGRIYSNGTPEDLAEVHKLQDQLSLVPLGAYGKPYTPPRGKVDPSIDMKTAVRDQVDRLDAAAFFDIMAKTMKTNPPRNADGPMVEKLAKIGIVPGANFDAKKLPAKISKALEEVPKRARARMMEYIKTDAGKVENNWIVATDLGQYGTNYVLRAATAMAGFGANRAADAVYPATGRDGEGQLFDASAHSYVLHFDKGKEPPVKGFWSVTMYTPEMFFASNRLNRYALGNRSSLGRNADGSVDIYLQKESPGTEKESNWLPAPEGAFRLVMRLYWPSENAPTILDGSWKPPAVKRAK